MHSRSHGCRAPRGQSARGGGRRWRLGLCAAFWAVLGASWISPALAADEDEWELSAALGGTELRSDGRWDPGWQLGAEAQRGLREPWSLRLGLSAGWHPVDAQGTRPSGRVQPLMGSLGLVYALDVVRAVPFAELGVDLLRLSMPGGSASTHVGLQAGLGLTYHVDAFWSLAGVLRYGDFPVRLPGGAADRPRPMMIVLALRLCRQL